MVVFYRPFENMAGNLACDSKYLSSGKEAKLIKYKFVCFLLYRVLFSLKYLILFDIKEFGSGETGTNPIPYGNGLA